METVQAAAHTARPRLLFVDDEQRVLNSMRIMFRRKFDLYLASHGQQALDIVKENDIDVIIADHRMPQMTGVEVLTAVRTLSPRTVRILLTGYADLDAVEGSINESEVFRFLTKPCPPDQLRSTIELAATVARETTNSATLTIAGESPLDIGEPLAEDLALVGDAAGSEAAAATAARALQPAVQSAATDSHHVRTAVLEKVPLPVAAPDDRSKMPAAKNGLGVVVFSGDDDVADCVRDAVRGRVPIFHANNIVKVVNILTEHRPGVLVTDISEDKATIQRMTAQLKTHLPELVTIAISQHRDVLDMVWLINHGQIFRFLRKPLSAGRCAISLQSALQHHSMLLKNPELLKRHEVEQSEPGGFLDSVRKRLRSVKDLWASS